MRQIRHALRLALNAGQSQLAIALSLNISRDAVADYLGSSNPTVADAILDRVVSGALRIHLRGESMRTVYSCGTALKLCGALRKMISVSKMPSPLAAAKIMSGVIFTVGGITAYGRQYLSIMSRAIGATVAIMERKMEKNTAGGTRRNVTLCKLKKNGVIMLQNCSCLADGMSLRTSIKMS